MSGLIWIQTVYNLIRRAKRVTNILFLLACEGLNLSMLILQHNRLQGDAEPDQLDLDQCFRPFNLKVLI